MSKIINYVSRLLAVFRLLRLTRSIIQFFFIETCAIVCLAMGVKLLFTWYFAIALLLLIVPATLALEHRRLKYWAFGFYLFLPAFFWQCDDDFLQKFHLRWIANLTSVVYYPLLVFLFCLFVLKIRQLRDKSTPVRSFETLWGN